VNCLQHRRIGEMDFRILRMLYRNSELTYADMAEKLKTTSVTIHNRLKKLKENNVYRKCIVVDPTIYGKNVSAYVFVSTVPGKERLLAEKIARTQQVLKVKGITGDFDLLVEVVANNIDELQQLVMAKIRALEGVVRTHTVIAVFATKDEISYVQ
jgi:DNA-binding Lrp family transcriptional regulator